jgi:pimeloyl-ACP methyl ester carboxylesterase
VNDASKPPEPLPELAAAAKLHRTKSGEGAMSWRSWGEGKPLVFLHGNFGSWRHWARNIPFFARTRRVIAADIPGLGESAAPSPYTAMDIAKVLQVGLDDILGHDRLYDLAGFSFGSTISAHLAAIDGAKVRTLTVVGGGTLGLPRGDTPSMKVRNLKGEERMAAHRFNLGSMMFGDPANIDDLAVAIQHFNTIEPGQRSRDFIDPSAMRNMLEMIARRADTPQATRVTSLWGERDAAAAPVIDRLNLIRSLFGDTRDLAMGMIPGAGHWLPYEHADIYNAILAHAIA